VEKRRWRAALQSGLPAARLPREAPWSAERSSALAAEQVHLRNWKNFVSHPALPRRPEFGRSSSFALPDCKISGLMIGVD